MASDGGLEGAVGRTKCLGSDCDTDAAFVFGFGPLCPAHTLEYAPMQTVKDTIKMYGWPQ